MGSEGWRGRMAGAFRRRWLSVVAAGIALLVIALFPLPAGGQSALQDMAGIGLGAEALEQGVRVVLWASFRGMHSFVGGSRRVSATGRRDGEGP